MLFVPSVQDSGRIGGVAISRVTEKSNFSIDLMREENLVKSIAEYLRELFQNQQGAAQGIFSTTHVDSSPIVSQPPKGVSQRAWLIG
jgi:hypothetical protein